MGREVSESWVESVLIEMVFAYCNRFYSSKPELAARRIEAIGYQVCHQRSERYTMERPRFSDHLEAIKFICKDFWSELFKKQIDNLKTNHRVSLTERYYIMLDLENWCGTNQRRILVCLGGCMCVFFFLTGNGMLYSLPFCIIDPILSWDIVHEIVGPGLMPLCGL